MNKLTKKAAEVISVNISVHQGWYTVDKYGGRFYPKDTWWYRLGKFFQQS